MFSCQQCEAVNKFIEESKILSPDLRRFATSLVTNTPPLLRTDPCGGGLEGTVTEMAVHTAAVLLCGQSQLLEPLKDLAFFPANMAVSWGTGRSPFTVKPLTVCHRGDRACAGATSGPVYPLDSLSASVSLGPSTMMKTLPRPLLFHRELLRSKR